MEVESCRFENNSAGQKGGAISGDGTDPSLIFNSTFIGNSAAEGGALAADQSCTFHLENTDFF